MEPLALGQAVVGGVLLFFLPGYAVAKAVFPERRVSGPAGVRWLLEVVALAFVVSIVLTVTVGYLLLVGSPGGFSASWSDPLLEAILAAITAVALVVGWFEGAYARVPPPAKVPPEEGAGVDAWELSERLDRLQRERLSLERQLRRISPADADAGASLRARRDHVLEEEEALRRRREAEYEL